MSDQQNTSKLSESKRQQIIDGARDVFMAKGFAAASMEQIAKAAGVSKGTLYNYFENKEMLYVALIQGECCKSEQHELPEHFSETSPEQVLEQIGQQWLISLLDPQQRALFRTVLAEALHFPQLGQAIEHNGPAIAHANLARYLAHLNDTGLLNVSDTALASEQFFALCDAGIVRKMQLSVAEPTAEVIKRQVSSAVVVFLKAYRS
ncbi:TetR/AcrR family transcriptional regulator [Chitinibacter sp. FCG-7]|uniref:TetR/AcrR family transcriptional regulator n=1 Tax=Chitinibacter mangrovi TaxID=3153927 RepID=A0AAU7F7A3_9NEIS